MHNDNTTAELVNNDLTLTKHKWSLGFKLTYIRITDYEFMQSLNVTKVTLEQFERLVQK